jgi:hypothetical protein
MPSINTIIIDKLARLIGTHVSAAGRMRSLCNREPYTQGG